MNQSIRLGLVAVMRANHHLAKLMREELARNLLHLDARLFSEVRRDREQYRQIRMRVMVPRQNPHNHLQCDIAEVLCDAWDMAILHPMCTYLTVSAAYAFKDPDYDRWPGVGYHQKLGPDVLTGAARREAREDALENFRRLLALPYPKAIENPARSFINTAIRPPDQVVQPYDFGDDASKATGLWLDRLPPLRPTKHIPPRVITYRGKVARRWANQSPCGAPSLPPSADRWLARSDTYPGIAAAMGDQWG